MTPTNSVSMKAITPNWAAYRQVCQYIRERGANNVLLTSKGEPCNWPDLVTEYLLETRRFGFPNVELQTNGIRIADRKPVDDAHLRAWRQAGLGLVAISITHYDPAMNRLTYTPERDSYIDLPHLIADLHSFGFQVRLACVMHRGQIDSVRELSALMAYAREHRVEQLTVRPVNRPSTAHDDDGTAEWIGEHFLPDETKQAMRAYLEEQGRIVERFSWGGIVFDINGQNVCLTNSLTVDEPGIDVGRQLIFFPEGKISDDWQKEGVWLHQYDSDVAALPAAEQLIQLKPFKARQRFVVTGFKPMKAVYSFMFPESWAACQRAHELMPLELFRVSTTAERANELLAPLVTPPFKVTATPDGLLDLDLLHEPVIERVVEAYKGQVPALSGFAWRYPGAGSSTGIFHLIRHIRDVKKVRTIHVLKGEYEGYKAQAENIGMKCREWSLADLTREKLAKMRPGYWFVSNPSARNGDILPDAFIKTLTETGHKVVVDLAYVGATAPHVFDVSPENVFAVVMSFSKPYGVFRLRAGGFIFCREAVPTLYGSRWFKDIERQLQTLKMAVDIGPSGLYAKYRPVQEMIVRALNDAYGLKLRPADSLLLATMGEAEMDLSADKRAMLSPFLRGSTYRLCITPYFEDAEKQGLTEG